MEIDRTCLGISLGTTCSSVGVWQTDHVEIIPNDQGNRTTPSCVAFTRSMRLIGDAAFSQAVGNIENTVFDVKLLIGRRYSDPVIAPDMKIWPFRVVLRTGDKWQVVVNYKGEERHFYPEEISSMVLSYLKKTAETFLGRPVKDAVISCPACFNDSQRQATKDAGTLAGLNVKKIINEPSAAAIAYSMEKRELGEKNVLIFDLGAGALDVSLVNIDSGVIKVRATSGNSHLGGEDFTNRMVEFCAAEFKRKKGIDLYGNFKALGRLRTSCERAKLTLSSATQVSIEISHLQEDADFFTIMTRRKFEELNMDAFISCLDHVKKVMRDAAISKNQVAEVILVGGSTQIPKVQQLLTEFFNMKKLYSLINNEAVTIGAAVQGAIISGSQSSQLQNLLLLDVTPLSLGLEAYGGVMTALVPRYTLLPAQRTKLFTTNTDNQPGVLIQVYEEERSLSRGYSLLGMFKFEGILPAPRGVPRIEATFDIDTDGIMRVSALEKVSNRSIKITVTYQKETLSLYEIKNLMAANAEQVSQEEEPSRMKIESRNGLESFACNIRNTLKDEVTYNKLSQKDKMIIETKVAEALKWIETNENADVKQFEAKLKDLKVVCNSIMMKIYPEEVD